jgi:hypothetical protein
MVVKGSHLVAEIFGNVSVVLEWLAKSVGGPLAIRRSRRKEKASKTEKIVLWLVVLAFNLNQSLQSLTILKTQKRGIRFMKTKYGFSVWKLLLPQS